MALQLLQTRPGPGPSLHPPLSPRQTLHGPLTRHPQRSSHGGREWTLPPEVIHKVEWELGLWDQRRSPDRMVPGPAAETEVPVALPLAPASLPEPTNMHTPTWGRSYRRETRGSCVAPQRRVAVVPLITTRSSGGVTMDVRSENTSHGSESQE